MKSHNQTKRLSLHSKFHTNNSTKKSTSKNKKVASHSKKRKSVKRDQKRKHDRDSLDRTHYLQQTNNEFDDEFMYTGHSMIQQPKYHNKRNHSPELINYNRSDNYSNTGESREYLNSQYDHRFTPTNLNYDNECDSDQEYHKMPKQKVIKSSLKKPRRQSSRLSNHSKQSTKKYQNNSRPQSRTQEYKEIVNARKVIQEYQDKINKFKKRLLQLDKQTLEWQDKFKKEQDKSDKYFTKAEKYKVIAKDFRKEIEKCKSEMGSLIEVIKNYESQIQQKEELELKQFKQKQFAVEDLLRNLKHLQKLVSQIDQQGILMNAFDPIFDSVRHLTVIDQVDGISNQTQPNTQTTINHENNHQYFIGDDGQYKMTPDHILYNGDNINQYEDQNYIQHHDNSYSQPISVNQSQQDNFTLSYNQSEHNSQNNQQFELLMKIQQEMTQIKEESQKVLHENQSLKAQNQQMNYELQKEQQKQEQQSLLPQYKEAFDQLRKANEKMQQKIEQLEKNKNDHSSNQSVHNEINEIKMQMQKYEYENRNLREERELFVQQIQNLESYNKNQEKMINYFQTSLMNSQQISGNQTQQVNQESFDLQNYMKQRTFNLNNSKSQLSQIQEQQSDDLTKSLIYLTNRSNENSSYCAQVQAFTLNNHKQGSDTTLLQQSVLNQRKSSSRIRGIQDSQNHKQSESSMYIETGMNDKSDNENNLFSLSSTQPENHFRALSPQSANRFARQLDFNQQQMLMNQIKNQGQAYVQQYLSQQNSQHHGIPKIISSEMLISEGQIYSQEVTNRDMRDPLIQNIHSNASTNNLQFHDQSVSDESVLEHSRLDMSMLNQNKNINKTGGSSQISQVDSDTSFLDKHFRKLRNQGKNQLQSQETFQMNLSYTTNSNQVSNDQIGACSRVTTNKNTQRSKLTQKTGQIFNNKENIEMIEEELQFNEQSNMKVQSPNFYDSQSLEENENTSNLQFDNRTNQIQLYDNNKKSSNQQSCSINRASTHSNYMSERTMCLKKEINSLDDEILQLQNSLKQALLKKGNEK